MLWVAIVAAALIFSLVVLLGRMFSQMNRRLEQMERAVQDATRTVGLGLGNASSVVGDVHEKLGRIEATNRQLVDIGKNITSLQDLLRAPKFRGQLGETLLENILAQVLPKDSFRIQHRFKSGEAVDAVIVLGERLVPIDAKFSLENFQRMVEASEEPLKQQFRKKFIQDIKSRVEEITTRYILPAEHTFDFALMYVPAENVYYEVIIKEDLLGYFLSRRVIPVSPNTFYAYLQVICLGLKGLRIEEHAQDILKHLGALSVDLQRFREDFETMGAHLANAARKYDDSSKRLERFSARIQGIQDMKTLKEPAREDRS